MIDYYIWRVLKTLKVYNSARDPDFRNYFNAFPCYHGSHVYVFYKDDWYEGFVVSTGAYKMIVDVGRFTAPVFTANVKKADRVLLTADIMRKINELQGLYHANTDELRADVDIVARRLETDAQLYKAPLITIEMLEAELFGKASHLQYREFYDQICQLAVGLPMGSASEERMKFQNKKDRLKQNADN